jgi:hypothetical protein
MALWKIGAASVGICLGMVMVPVASQARPLGTVPWMPFFGLPYPSGYVYQPPKADECYTYQEVYDPLAGPQIVPVWICDGAPPVRAKY